MTSLAKRFVTGVAAFALLLGAGHGLGPAHADTGDGRLEGEARRQAIETVRAIESDLAAVVDRVTDASVTILTRRHVGRDTRRRGFVAGAGSGTLIHYRGTHVLTNNHVVSHKGELEIVTSKGRVYPVRVRARDASNDLAVLTIERPDAHLRPVDLERDVSTKLLEGAWVVATGNPFLLAIDGGAVATLGVFSGSRVGPQSATYLLQHDAEINPGNSGGPLWNLDGELLGVNGAIVTRSLRKQDAGASFTGASISVPIARVRDFLDRVLPKTPTGPTAAPVIRREPVAARTATSAADRLGLSIASSLDAANQPDGVLVRGTLRGGAVADSRQSVKPQPGDRITGVTIDNQTFSIRAVRDLELALGRRPVETAFALRFERDGNTLTWSGVLR